ncbi:MAG: hypothetical protein R3F19_16420 [Verrucomicrobiales bacterium]
MTAAATAHRSSSAHLRDFPDLLSPIVVKELRQALRGGAFVGVFCFVQLGMLVITLLQLWAGESQLSDLDEVFWFACVLALVVLVPGGSFNALAGEVRGDTFQLLQLTQLSSWRIVVGKWTATLALIMLVAIGLLPFFVFRYFRGGVALVPELVQLAIVTGIGAVVAAFTVAFSAHQAVLVRVLAFLMIGVGGGLLMFGMILDEMTTQLTLPSIAMISLGACCLGLYALLMGAGTIAVGDENYSAFKRIFAMSVIATIAVVGLYPDWNPDSENQHLLLGFQIGLAAVFLFDSVTEAPRYGKGIVTKILRVRMVRRVALLRVWFYPGWQSGHLFFLPVVMLTLIALYQIGALDHDDSLIYNVLLGFASIIFPTALIQVHPAKVDRFVGRYCLLAVLMVVYCVILVGMSDTSYGHELGAATFFAAILTPFAALLMGEQQYYQSFAYSDSGEQSIFFIGTCVALLWYLALVLKGLLVSARIRAVEAVTRGELAVQQLADSTKKEPGKTRTL